MGSTQFYFGASILQMPTLDVKLVHVCLIYWKDTADYWYFFLLQENERSIPVCPWAIDVSCTCLSFLIYIRYRTERSSWHSSFILHSCIECIIYIKSHVKKMVAGAKREQKEQRKRTGKGEMLCVERVKYLVNTYLKKMYVKKCIY